MPHWLNEWLWVLLNLVPIGLWCAWWLWGVSWQKTWPVLAQGAWVPLVLLMLVSALAWSRLSPADCTCLGTPISSWWVHLFWVCGLTLLALFCGWVQGYFGLTPQDVDLEPPPVAHGHGHGHH